MPDDKTRKRMVVEEVSTSSNTPVNQEPVEEIKEKVEELQTLTEDISESVEKSAEVQEDLAKAAEEVVSQEKKEQTEIPSYKSQETDIPQAPQIKSKNGINPLMVIVPGIFLLGALLGGIFFYQKSVSQESGEPTPTPNYNNIVTPVPTASPETKLDLAKYPINVMNGSGTPGQAGTVKELLETAGFEVEKTGNAPSYDYIKTVIKAKSDVPEEYITKLTEVLSKNYEVDTKQSLSATSDDSVQVIIGSTKAK